MTCGKPPIFPIFLSLVVMPMMAKVTDAAEYIVGTPVNQPATENSYYYPYATQFAERMSR